MRTLGVIIARAGSKGLPGKNTLDVAGRPMIAWTIEHALAARRLDHLVASTDDERAKQIAAELGVEVIDRPAELAGDTVTVDAVVRHALRTVEQTGRNQEPVDAVVILYGNLPVRPGDLTDRAVEKLRQTGCDSVQSVSPVGKSHPYWMKRLDGDRLLAWTENQVYRRQDLPPAYMLDGGIIAVTRAALMTEIPGKPHAFLGDDRRAVTTEPGEVVDVDREVDLAVATAAVERRLRLPNRGLTLRGWNQPTCVIAELGVNHDGSVEQALALTEAAAEAGADAVKLQLFDPDVLLSADAELAGYQAETADDPHAMLRALTLEADEMAKVRDRAQALALGFVLTCFSLEEIQPLEALSPDAVKIASPDCVNRPLIEAVGGLHRPRLISTGAATSEEIGRLLGWLAGDPTALLLACVSAYPTPNDAASLERIAHLRRFADRVGYSDHTTDVMTGALAVAAGASVIEKHLTWDSGAAGPDHAASLDPTRFAAYVRHIRQAERMRGERWAGEALAVEADVRRVSRQSVCTARDLPAGRSLSRDDLTVRRPGTGIPAAWLHAVVGRRLARDVSAGRVLDGGDLRTD